MGLSGCGQMTSATTPSSKCALDELEAGVLGLSSGGRDAKTSGAAEVELLASGSSTCGRRRLLRKSSRKDAPRAASAFLFALTALLGRPPTPALET